MKPQTSPASFQTPASDSGLAFGGGVGVCGKNDDDIVTPTPRTTLRKSHFTRYLQYFRDVSHLI